MDYSQSDQFRFARVTVHDAQAKRRDSTSFAFKQTVRPGGFDTMNRYVIDGEKRTETVPIFGEVTMHARYLSRNEITPDQIFGTGIQGDAEKDVALLEVTESESMRWRGETLWIFETINGEYRLCKYNTIRRNGQTATAKMVHDYLGPPN